MDTCTWWVVRNSEAKRRRVSHFESNEWRRKQVKLPESQKPTKAGNHDPCSDHGQLFFRNDARAKVRKVATCCSRSLCDAHALCISSQARLTLSNTRLCSYSAIITRWHRAARRVRRLCLRQKPPTPPVMMAHPPTLQRRSGRACTRC